MEKTRNRQFSMDLVELHAVCEANYARLLRLFPAYETANIHEFNVGPSRVILEVMERCRYTTFFCLRQQHAEAKWLGSLKVEVRAYHDARMLEVGSFQSHRRIQPRYQYPNTDMHQQDEKAQQNRFLADWLGHCLANGHSATPVCARAAGS